MSLLPPVPSDVRSRMACPLPIICALLARFAGGCAEQHHTQARLEPDVGTQFRIQSDGAQSATSARIPLPADEPEPATTPGRPPAFPAGMSDREKVLRSVLSENDHGARPFLIIDKQAAEVPDGAV